MIGTSCFLPDSVRGLCGASKIWSGTKRGDTAVLIASAMRASSAASSVCPGRSTTNSAIQLGRPRYSRSITIESCTSGSASTAA